MDLAQARDIQRHVTEDHGQVAALSENVGAKPPETRFGDGEINLEFSLEIIPLILGHHAETGVLHLFHSQQFLAQRHDLALDLDLDRCHGREEQVRGVLLRHQL